MWNSSSFIASVLDILPDVVFFEVVCSCTLDILQAYLAFCRTVEADW